MGWLIVMGIVLFLAILPLGVWFRYDESGMVLRIVAGPVKITLIPRPMKEKKEKKPPAKKQPAVPGAQEQLPKPPQPPKKVKPKQQAKGGSILDFLPLVHLALDLLGDLRRKLRLDDLYVRIILGSTDPCNLAVSYGRTWAAVGNLMPQLERLFVIKKRDIEVECDFTASKTMIVAQLELTITLGRLLCLAVIYAVRAIKELLIIKKKRKGGAVI